MANGATDAQESDFWKAKADGLVSSMRQYVRNRGEHAADTAADSSSDGRAAPKVVDDDDGLIGSDRESLDNDQRTSNAKRDSSERAHSSSQISSGGAEGRSAMPTNTVELHSFPLGRASAHEGDTAAAAGAAAAVPDNLWVAEHVGLPLCEAMQAYRGVS